MSQEPFISSVGVGGGGRCPGAGAGAGGARGVSRVVGVPSACGSPARARALCSYVVCKCYLYCKERRKKRAGPRGGARGVGQTQAGLAWAWAWGDAQIRQGSAQGKRTLPHKGIPVSLYKNGKQKIPPTLIFLPPKIKDALYFCLIPRL